MEIVWDEPKRGRNLRDHRLDFAAARERFNFAEALIEPSYSAKDGHTRFIALGRLDGRIVTLVFSARNGGDLFDQPAPREPEREETL